MNKDFIPFGSQYYRAPTPLPDQWASDMKTLHESGFNVIKIWAQWRWNNPKENVYYFDDLDELMDTAAKNGLKVIINVIFDVVPAWFYNKYPESVMITEDGRKVNPVATACRSIGGAPGPCYHSDAAKQCKVDFLTAVVKRYKDHPAMYIWDLWNEPELTCAILREPKLHDMVCYCDDSHSKFIRWLQDKYVSVK